MNVAQLYMSSVGRVGRRTWWLGHFFPVIVGTCLLASVDRFTGSNGALLAAWWFITLWPSIVLTVKRLHDLNLSGWWLLTLCVPVLGPLYNFIQCGFFRGTLGSNRFGPDPRFYC